MAFIAEAEGQGSRAVKLLSAAAHLRESAQAAMTEPERSECDQHGQLLRTEMGTAEFESSWANGEALNFAQPIALALSGAL